MSTALLKLFAFGRPGPQKPSTARNLFAANTSTSNLGTSELDYVKKKSTRKALALRPVTFALRGFAESVQFGDLFLVLLLLLLISLCARLVVQFPQLLFLGGVV